MTVGDNSPHEDYTNYPSKLTVTGSNSVYSNLLGSILLSTKKHSTAELNVTDNGLLVHNGAYFFVGEAVGGNGLLNISSGGVVDARLTTQYMSIGRHGTGTVSVTGNGSKLLAPGEKNVILGYSANTSQGTLIIENDGVVEKSGTTGNLYVGYSTNTTDQLIVRDNGVLRWGGSGTVYVGFNKSQGLVSVESGGLVEVENGDFVVYSNSTLRIDGGRIQSVKSDLQSHVVFNAVLWQGDANNTALMTASGEGRIRDAVLTVEKGADFVYKPGDVYTLMTASPLHATYNRFAYDGSVLQDGDIIDVGGTIFKVGYTANTVTLTVRQTGTLIFVN